MKLRAAVAACIALAACGRLGFDDLVPGIGSGSIAVVPADPEHGSAWNDYVQAGTDVACDDTGDFAACEHGGELREVTLPGPASCDGLALADELGAFTWTCRAGSGGVTWRSALAPGRGLRDLIDFDALAWRPNRVALAGGALATEPAVWWGNPVLAAPASGSLAQPGAVYAVGADETTSGYTLDAPRVALVSRAGVTIARAPGAIGGAVVSTVGQPQLWVEVAVNAKQGHDGIRLTTTRFSQVVGSTATGGVVDSPSGGTLVLDDARGCRVRHFRSLASGGYGVYVGDTADSDGNYFFDLGVAQAADRGVYLHAGTRNVFEGVVAANGARDGLSLGAYCDGGAAENNTVAGVRSFGNAAEGVYINSNGEHVVDALLVGNQGHGAAFSNNCGYPWGSSLVGAVAAFNGDAGVVLTDHNTTVANVVALGNGGSGYDFEGDSWWAQLAAGDNVLADYALEHSVELAGNVIAPTASSCHPVTGATGLDDACAPNGGSTAHVVFDGSLLAEFVGPVTSDAANASAVAGQATFPPPADFDWFSFADAHRVWGRWDAAGAWTAGSGQILDFRLAPSATKLRGTTGTGSAGAPNEPFVAGAPCPSAASGDAALENHVDQGGFGGYASQTYLSAAIEIVAPSQPGYTAAGNHDGLCESGEACLYAPSFGAAQGSGAVATCVFADGAVRGVTLYGTPD